MRETLIRKLHEYVSDNNPDLLLTLQEGNRLTNYLQSTVSSVDGLIDQLLSENKSLAEIEEICLNELTKSLKPSRFNYLKNIVEEEFPDKYSRLYQNGLLNAEIINLISACNSAFDELNFSEQNEDHRHLRYAIIGAIHEYFTNEKSEKESSR